MDFVEQGGKALNFVDDHRPSGRKEPQFTAKEPRVTEIALIESFVEEIEPVGVGEELLGPGALSDTAQARVLDSFNVCDFWRLHSELRPHGGKVLAQQQRYSTGEQMRRLLRVS